MKDKFGREIDYIRISVTDRCNLRCRYCMPEEGISLISHEEMLTFEELERICRVGAELGLCKVKITGGEPLVRKNVSGLIERLTLIPGIVDITMTSNGCLLEEEAKRLKLAGLSCINISLDTLDPGHFAYYTRRDAFEQVTRGIKAAKQAGLRVKINCAVMEDLTPEDVLAFAEFSMEEQVVVRFIEMMPIGQGRAYEALDNQRLYEILKEKYPDLKETDKVQGNGPAVYCRFAGGLGTVGFISAVHHKFCGSCNRIRLASNGFLKLCLASNDGIDLRTAIRSGISDQGLKGLIYDAVSGKPESHHFEDKEDKEALGLRHGDWNMNQIGG